MVFYKEMVKVHSLDKGKISLGKWKEAGGKFYLFDEANNSDGLRRSSSGLHSFQNLDKDVSGGISLDEWKKAGGKLYLFEEANSNQDSIVTSNELRGFYSSRPQGNGLKMGKIPPILSHCSTRFEDGTLKNATSSELVECCLKRCYPTSKYCKKRCDTQLKVIFAGKKVPPQSLKKCRKNCRSIDQSCISECLAVSPGYNLDNGYYRCADTYGCPPIDLGQRPTPKCVGEHRESILKCCKSTCIPTSIIDCDDYCNMWDRITMNPDSLGIPSDLYPSSRANMARNDSGKSAEYSRVEKKEVLKGRKGYSSKTPIYLVIGVSIGVLVLILLLLLLRRWKRD